MYVNAYKCCFLYQLTLINREADGISGNSGSVLILTKWNSLAAILRASKFSAKTISGFLIV